MPNNNQQQNINKPNYQDLASSQVLAKYEDYITHLMIFDSIQEANSLARGLEILLNKNRNLAKSHPDYFERYEKVIALAKFLTLSYLTDKEAISLVENHLADALNNPDIILVDKIDAKILTTLDREARDTFKRELRAAMLRNKQQLTTKNITTDNLSKKPTVSNWVKDYNNVVGAEVASQIDRVEYLSSGKNIKQQSAQDKSKVEALINLYEHLKKSSITLEGLEEAVPYYFNDKHYVLKAGKLELIKPSKILLDVLGKKEGKTTAESTQQPTPAGPSTVEQEVIEAYQGDPREQKAVIKEETKLTKQFQDDVAKLREEFFKTVQKKNINRTIAILRILTQKNDLPNFIKKDAKLNKFLAAIWEKQYGVEIVEEFKKNPTDVRFIRLFLRYVLEQRLEMDKGEAARVGLQLGNIFVEIGKKEYNKMAYFDVKDKSFKWFEGKN